MRRVLRGVAVVVAVVAGGLLLPAPAQAAGHSEGSASVSATLPYPCPGTCAAPLSGTAPAVTIQAVAGSHTINAVWLGASAVGSLQLTEPYLATLGNVDVCPAAEAGGQGVMTLRGGTPVGVVTIGTVTATVTALELDMPFTYVRRGALAVVNFGPGGQLSVSHTAGFTVAHTSGAGVFTITTTTVPTCDVGQLTVTLSGPFALAVG